MFDFSKVVDRHGTWCTQWDYVADRFGTADLLPFTISDMDFATAPCIIEALNQRLIHGVFGYSRWKNDEFLAAIAHWFSTQHYTAIDPQSVVYGPSVIYMVSELIRQWSETGEGVVIHTPAYDAFYKAIEGNQRTVMPVALEKQPDGWFCDMGKLEAVLAKPECKIMLLCSPQNPTGKVWTCDELEIMADLCERHGVRVISDEIHMDMVWGEQPHIPWSNVARGDWALLTSGSKSFNIPALTGAYGIIENSSSRDAYLSVLKGRDGLSSPSVLALTAHIAAYQQGAPWLDALRVYLKDNLTYIADKMNAAFPELNWQIPQSTYLAWLDLRPLNIDDNALQKALIEQEKIAIMPGYTYGEEGRGFVRLNAGCPRSKLEKGVAGLINAIRAVG
ncbi:bifunctional maltose regulon transcriptional repressor/cystathionine beta-lyase MalY [Escherichia coli O170:H5]|uniref:bifunctional maltose regulon transcriptional repressor/cystathionine beta-lyase MalY n=1 Tax=Escherichia coli TaxID=562 RepID=UPI000BDFAFA0|nr:bifunctional maltose regulon transcriptional repressor/cystathionine beta-lyase MalY [Escherichia coli]EIL7518607.1 bifunctional maltose regulon transcriptional repressor/cystathionine beta-lyase MalY [Escherichia coli]EKH2378583.1 bifunctional maltose regulon transcriptional repressor/cystathionine beta-lyase MalY [Escherichia coli]EKO0813934.1 bifunctional maltose regulon transcriptional repressor/cystathionine beta-lyase MalY [Escherichia coli]HAL0084586.1 bifunctional maltose regulon tra